MTIMIIEISQITVDDLVLHPSFGFEASSLYHVIQ